MIPFSVKDLAQVTGGKILSAANSQFHNIGTDTRTSLKGQAFFALKGEAFDAHAFLPQAVVQGAAVLVVHDEKLITDEMKSQVSVVLVNDTLVALQDLSQFYRRQMRAKIIGITGSNGKTTTKEFTAALINPYKKVHYNKGSFNNHWGVPFTLLSIEPTHEVAVVEMGMNHAGELTVLAKIASPDVVVVTTVGRAHMEAFGTIDKVAAAKNEIYTASPAEATRVYNLDNPECRKLYVQAEKLYPKAKIISFGAGAEADVSLQLVSMDLQSLTLKGRIGATTGQATVPVFGAQNVTNLMAASCMALAVGLTGEQIWKALPLCKTAWGRNQLLDLESKAQMIFDGYNANPDSVRALLENVKQLKVQGKKHGAFGEMLEMGELSPKLHEELGALVSQVDFESVFFVGPHAADFERGLKAGGFKKNSFISDSYNEKLAAESASMLRDGDIVVVKGSRGMRLERYAQACHPRDFNVEKK